jgi:hypothetical protein
LLEEQLKMIYDNYLQLYREEKLYSTFLTLLEFYLTYMSFILYLASWHVVHHVKNASFVYV